MVITKKLFLTTGRERDLIRYSIGSNLNEAKVYSYEQAKEILLKKNPNCKADEFLKKVMASPSRDWIEY